MLNSSSLAQVMTSAKRTIIDCNPIGLLFFLFLICFIEDYLVNESKKKTAPENFKGGCQKIY